jgi:hypothetical protein
MSVLITLGAFLALLPPRARPLGAQHTFADSANLLFHQAQQASQAGAEALVSAQGEVRAR